MNLPVLNETPDLPAPTLGRKGELTISQLLTSRQPESLYWPSCASSTPSVWHGHVTFAHWIVAASQPRRIVELGTHYGVSFLAFCNAVQRLQMEVQCFAIDTWAGDEHTGAYSEKIYADLTQFVEGRFPGFAQLVRDYFDTALNKFADGSIDLLHIDGLHTYEAVSHDFRTWLPKMSSRGVILFHDIAVRDRDFGVWRLWAEITPRWPNFRFEHSAGLGVLAVGSEVPRAVLDLCDENKTNAGHQIRQRFEALSDEARRSGGYYQSIVSKSIGFRRNLALGCATTQSSSSPFGMNRLRHPSAVDGVKSGGFGFHTEFEDKPWWQVDLASDHDIGNVVIYNRLDGLCAARARTICVLLSCDGSDWAVLYQHDSVTFGGIDSVPLITDGEGRRARYVRVQLQHRDALHLDQVEVYGTE
jgi:hypothetical protein